MKNGMLKRRTISLLMAMILTGSLAVTGIQNPDAGSDVVQAAEGTTGAVATFHAEQLPYVDDQTIPVCNQTEYEDYIFAGWYSNELCKEDQIMTSSDLKAAKDAGTAVYAKFIPADVLSVKCQLPENFSTSDSSTNLRVVTTLDSEMYSDIGFSFYKRDEAQPSGYKHLDDYYYSDSEDNRLYKKIVANDGGVAYSYSANIFDLSSIAYFTGTVTGIKQSLFDDDILIKPFLITKNGTQVYGVSKTVNFAESYNGIISVPVYMNSDRDLGNGTVTVTPRPFADAEGTTADIEYVGCVQGDSGNDITASNNGNVVTLSFNTEGTKANGLLATLKYKAANGAWADKAPRYTFDIQSASSEADDLSNVVYKFVDSNREISQAEPADSTSSYSQVMRAMTSGYGSHFQVPVRSSEGATGFSAMVKATGTYKAVTYTLKNSVNGTIKSGTITVTDEWTQLNVERTDVDWSKVAYITFLVQTDNAYKPLGNESDARFYLDNLKITGDTTANDFEVVDVFHRNLQASGTTPYTAWYGADTIEGDSNTYVLATLPEFYGFQQLSYQPVGEYTKAQLFTGETIMLASDLVLNTDHANYKNWKTTAPTNKWLGIGGFSGTQNCFDGTFDGQGHDIYGVYMDGATDSKYNTTANGRGFFNRAAGTIKNFRLRNSFIKGTGGAVGSIVGTAYTGAGGSSKSLTLEGVYSNAYVRSTSTSTVGVGGLVGEKNIAVTFNNCQYAGVNSGSRASYRADGGLIGLHANTTGVTVTNCAVTGEIIKDGNASSSTHGGKGGIVGKINAANAPLSVEGCYINFSVDATTATGETLQGAVAQRTNKAYNATVKNVLNDTSLKFAASVDLGSGTGDVCEGLLKGSADTSETWKAEGFFDATYWDVSGDVPVLKSFKDIQ